MSTNKWCFAAHIILTNSSKNLGMPEVVLILGSLFAEAF
jgi:hypothetical protein